MQTCNLRLSNRFFALRLRIYTGQFDLCEPAILRLKYLGGLRIGGIAVKCVLALPHSNAITQNPVPSPRECSVKPGCPVMA